MISTVIWNGPGRDKQVDIAEHQYVLLGHKSAAVVRSVLAAVVVAVVAAVEVAVVVVARAAALEVAAAVVAVVSYLTTFYIYGIMK